MSTFKPLTCLKYYRHKILPKNGCKERIVSKGIFEGAEVVAASNLMHDFKIDGKYRNLISNRKVHTNMEIWRKTETINDYFMFRLS